MYENGEYIRAYDISKEILDPEETPEKKDIGAIENELLLVRAESFLQNGESLSEIDENQLYKDITDSLKEAGLESVQDSLDEPVTDPVIARLRLAQCMLAGRIGIDASYSGLSEICEQLFDSDSNTGLYIIAALVYQDGNYDKAIAICNRLIKAVDSQDFFYNRVLLLKSDALVAKASLMIQDGKSKSDVEGYYAEAEELLIEIREMSRNDYIVSSQRLKEVYELMEEYDKAHEIEEELAKMQ